MSDPVWDGGKDKNAFRIMSDKVGGTSGVRTVVQTQGDTTTTLRTRAGNPEVTVEKAGDSPFTLREVAFKTRKFHLRSAAADNVGGDAVAKTVPDDRVSTMVLFVKKIITAAGALIFKKPPEELNPWPEGKRSGWYEPKRSYSSDGIFYFYKHSPKRAMLADTLVRFDEVPDLPGDISIEQLESPQTEKGFVERTFYKPKLFRGWKNRGVNLFITNPVKSVSIKAISKAGPRDIHFDDPVESPAENALFHNPDNKVYAKDGEVLGIITPRLNYFDHVRVWGNPYHGTMDYAGSVTLPDGRIIQGHPVIGTQHQLVKFADTPPPSYMTHDSAFESSLSTANLEWKDYAILVGDLRRYSPVCGMRINEKYFRFADGAGGNFTKFVTYPSYSSNLGTADVSGRQYYDNTPGESAYEDVSEFGTNSWLYKTAAGEVWRLRLRHHPRRVDACVEAMRVNYINSHYGSKHDNPPNAPQYQAVEVCDGIYDPWGLISTPHTDPEWGTEYPTGVDPVQTPHLGVLRANRHDQTKLSASADGRVAVFSNMHPVITPNRPLIGWSASQASSGWLSDQDPVPVDTAPLDGRRGVASSGAGFGVMQMFDSGVPRDDENDGEFMRRASYIVFNVSDPVLPDPLPDNPPSTGYPPVVTYTIHNGMEGYIRQPGFIDEIPVGGASCTWSMDYLLGVWVDPHTGALIKWRHKFSGTYRVNYRYRLKTGTVWGIDSPTGQWVEKTSYTHQYVVELESFNSSEEFSRNGVAVASVTSSLSAPPEPFGASEGAGNLSYVSGVYGNLTPITLNADASVAFYGKNVTQCGYTQQTLENSAFATGALGQTINRPLHPQSWAEWIAVSQNPLTGELGENIQFF